MKKRIRIYREDHPTADGRCLTETLWKPAPLPVLTVGPNQRVIGTINRLQHDRNTGWVTAVLKTKEDVAGLAAQADFIVGRDSCEETDGVLVLKGAVLTGIHLGDRPVWAGMTI